VCKNVGKFSGQDKRARREGEQNTQIIHICFLETHSSKICPGGSSGDQFKFETIMTVST